MSFSGGVYTLPGPALVTGEVVSATENNQFRNDVAGAFNLTFLRNGTSTATANLPMGGYKLTGLGVATTSGDALSYGQAAVVSDITATGSITVNSGTANGVAYLNGSKVLTTGSALTFDGNAVSINGTTNTITLRAVSTSNTLQIQSRPDISYSRLLSSSYLLDIATEANQPILFTVNGTEQMRLTSTGLGIGTSSPYNNGAGQGALEVKGASYPVISASTASIATQMGVGSAGGYVGTRTNHNFAIGVNDTARLTVDTSGNLGLGVTPSAWYSSWKAMQIGAGLALSSSASSGYGHIAANCYLDSSATWRYSSNSYAQKLSINGDVPGAFAWYLAPNGTAGNAISFTQAMTLDASGNLGLGTSSPAGWNGRVLSVASSANDAGIRFDGNLGSWGIGGCGTATGSNALRFYNFTASSEAMRIDSSGNVGIGTSSPAAKLDVNPSSGTVFRAFTSNVAQILIGNGGTSANYYDGDTQVFRSGNATERMRIDSSGRVGVNVVPAGSYTFTVVAQNAGDNGALNIDCKDNILGSAWSRNSDGKMMAFYRSFSTQVGYISTTATATTYSTSSDYRLKENIQPMQNALDVVAQLNPVRYTWKADGSDGQGFIAHELQAVVPDCVTGEKDAVDAEGKPVYQGIDTSFLVATLTKAIQELKAELDATKAEVAALKGN